MRSSSVALLSSSFALSILTACGDTPAGGQASASPSATAASSAKASGGAPTSTASAAAPATPALPEGVVPVAKLAEIVKASPKVASGQKVQAEGVYWGMSTETSGDKKTYVLEIVASKDDTSSKALCRSNTDPTELPHADNQAHDKAIAVVVEGTLSASMSNKPVLSDCTYKKK